MSRRPFLLALEVIILVSDAPFLYSEFQNIHQNYFLGLTATQILQIEIQESIIEKNFIEFNASSLISYGHS